MIPADGVTALVRRVAALDSDPGGNIIRDSEKFIGVLDTVTGTGDHTLAPIVSAAEADAVVDTCRLIRRVAAAEPVLVADGVDGHPQYWVSTGKPPWVPPRDPVPSPGGLTAGLYTSTGFQGTQGMWRLYLDLGHYSSNFPHPWYAWRIEGSGSARVFNITTAAEWEEIALRYPAADGDLIYPDWAAMAADFDAAHVTIRAIAAIQGMRIHTPRGLLRPSYWDVETTFWLRWSFASVTPAETVEAAAGGDGGRRAGFTPVRRGRR